MFCGGIFHCKSRYRDNSVAENNPTFAYTIIIFIEWTYTYTITFKHHCEGHLGPGLLLSLKPSQKNIFCRRSNISCVSLFIDFVMIKRPGLFICKYQAGQNGPCRIA